MKNSHKYDGIDLTGQRHGRLVALKKSDHGRTWWICRCDCGNVKELPANKFFAYQSCGCLEKENRYMIAGRTRTHGKTETKLYAIYCGMKSRCSNPHYKHYDKYGGRGIKVCDEWKESFEAFEKWAYDNGYVEGLNGKTQSIDRINLDGDYEPSNCRWSTQTEQVRNRRNTRWVVFNGKQINPYEFCNMFGITNKVYVYRHLDKGETGEKILEHWRRLHPL